MTYDMQIRYWGINKDGTHDEYSFSPRLRQEELSELLLKFTQESFGDKVVSVTFNEPKK